MRRCICGGSREKHGGPPIYFENDGMKFIAFSMDCYVAFWRQRQGEPQQALSLPMGDGTCNPTEV